MKVENRVDIIITNGIFITGGKPQFGSLDSI